MRAITCCALLLGCAPTTGDLVDNTRWEALAEEDDPLLSHKPDDAECPDSAWYVEGGRLEVFTGACDYASLTQPLLLDVRSDQSVEIVGWYANLFADAPAEAHLAARVGDTLLWEQHVAIPAEAGVINATITPGRRLVEGEPVVFHLHNHGANSWELVAIRTRDPAR